SAAFAPSAARGSLVENPTSGPPDSSESPRAVLMIQVGFVRKWISQSSHGRSKKKCWIDRLALRHSRDEKENNQPNTVSYEHPPADLQFHSGARGFHDRADYGSGGQVTHI